MIWPRRWAARWIWLGDDRPGDRVILFRSTAQVASVPDRAPCRVTADGRYQLWVNGTLVGRGPVRSEPAHLTWDEYDLSDLLVVGENTIGVLARHYGGPVAYWKPARPMGAVGRGGVLFEADLTGGRVGTSSDWRALDAPYFLPSVPARFGPPAVEILDGRAWPFGWAEAGFNDETWSPAVEALPTGLGIVRPEPPTEPFGLLGPSPIGPPTEHIVGPARLVASGPAAEIPAVAPSDPLADFHHDPAGQRGDGSAGLVPEPGQWLTFDFGRILNAYPILEVDGAAGAVVDLACGEDLDAAGHPVVAPRDWTLRYTTAGRAVERVEALEPVGFRYLQAAVRNGEVARLRLSARERHHPRPPGAYFTCSDPLLDELWEAGARTLDACSTDAFIDCPGREQRAWLGDAYLDTLVSLVCNPDTALVRWNARLHGQGARADGLRPMVAAGDFTDHTTIPDFSLHWVRTLARIWEHLGDAELIESLLPRALDVCAWFERHRGPDGLLAGLAGWVFVDWAQTERRDQIAVVDALYAMTLDDLAMLADAVGDTGSAGRARNRADQTRVAFARYWDADRHVYVDAADPGSEKGRRVSQQTNALAILSGAAPQHEWDPILEYVLDPARLVVTETLAQSPVGNATIRQSQPPERFNQEIDVVVAQPFFAHFVHQAVVAAGRRDLLLGLLRRWSPLLARGNGVFEEFWDAPPGTASRCHAWSATPTYDLSTHILGVSPAASGYRRVSIRPWLRGLDHIRGSVPTPAGFVRLALDRGGRGWVELPEGVHGVLTIAEFGGIDLALHPGRQSVGT